MTRSAIHPGMTLTESIAYDYYTGSVPTIDVLAARYGVTRQAVIDAIEKEAP